MSDPDPTPASPHPPTPDSHPPRVSFGAVVSSILAAAFGVQSSRSRERDFAQGNYRHFIIGGIVFTVLFVATLVVVVRMVLGDR